MVCSASAFLVPLRITNAIAVNISVSVIKVSSATFDSNSSSILGNNALSANLELRFLITSEKSFLSITTPFKEGEAFKEAKVADLKRILVKKLMTLTEGKVSQGVKDYLGAEVKSSESKSEALNLDP